MKQLIFTLSKNIPTVRANLFGAIQRNLDEWKTNRKALKITITLTFFYGFPLICSAPNLCNKFVCNVFYLLL